MTKTPPSEQGRFGDRLKEIRTRRKLSLGYVAERAEMSRSGVFRIETGERKPTLDTLVRLARALDIRIVIDPRQDPPVRADYLPGGEE